MRFNNRGDPGMEGVILGVIGVVVTVVVALALLPTISSSVADAQGDDNLTSQQQSLIGLTTLFAVVGISLLGIALIFVALKWATA